MPTANLGTITVSPKNKQQDNVQLLADLLAKAISAQPSNSKENNQQQKPMVQENPYTKGASKALQEAGYSHAQEAVSSGVNPNDINAMIQKMIQPQQPDQLTQQAQQTMQNPDYEYKRGLIGALLEPIFGRPSGEVDRGMKLENIQKTQAISGQTPAQRKDIELEIVKSGLQELENKGKTGTLTANEIFTKFEPVANNFQSIVDSYARVQASTKNPSAAGDIALIFNYMKILDPQSTVREGEAATIQNAGSIPDVVRRWYNQSLSGKRFTDKIRNDISDRAKKLYESKKMQYEDTEKQFSTLAEKNAINPENVLRKVKLIESNIEEKQKSISEMSDEELKAIIGGK